MTILNLKNLMVKYNLKNDTMKESGFCKFPIYPRDSKVYSDTTFVNIDNGSDVGTHWVCFIAKDKKILIFYSFGGHRDKILLNQLPKPINYHK